jgi:hypothetical protein
MTHDERVQVARIYLLLTHGVPASEGVMHSLTLLDELLGLPGTAPRRAAFLEAHTTAPKVTT